MELAIKISRGSVPGRENRESKQPETRECLKQHKAGVDIKHE